MDYEKKYDEALERAKQIRNGNPSSGTAIVVCEQIFPELRESEDEMIRRTLVEYFGPEAQLDFVRGVPIQKIRDWLEKQKEQKPVDYCSVRDEFDLDGNLKGSNKTNDLVAELKHHLATTPKEQLEKEWKELEHWGNIGPTVQEFLYGKPVEWSEGDKEKLYQVIETLLADKEIALREYPLCKPLHKAYDDMITFLKSLRPSWKPSEEQIKSLIRATNRCVSPKDVEPLMSLYNDLKKL